MAKPVRSAISVWPNNTPELERKRGIIKGLPHIEGHPFMRQKQLLSGTPRRWREKTSLDSAVRTKALKITTRSIAESFPLPLENLTAATDYYPHGW